MTRKQIILIVLGGLLLISVVIVITSLFVKARTEKTYYKELSQVYKDQLAAEVQVRKDAIAAFQDAMDDDSAYHAQFLANQPKYITIKQARNEIPAHVESLGDNADAIRKAIATYKPN